MENTFPVHLFNNRSSVCLYLCLCVYVSQCVYVPRPVKGHEPFDTTCSVQWGKKDV